jgi:hypothetical protein
MRETPDRAGFEQVIADKVEILMISVWLKWGKSLFLQPI